MKKLKRKTKKVKEEKAAESTSKLDALILKDKVEDQLKEFDRRISENKQAIDDLLAEPKDFEPIVTAISTGPEKPLVSRYDDVCKEIDKKIK